MRVLSRKITPESAETFDTFNFDLLNYGEFITRIKWKKRMNYYDRIITLDTETTKYDDETVFVTDWSITIEEISCIYGHHVRDCVNTISKIMQTLGCDETHRIVIYVHNFPYDYMFLRNHLFETFGSPVQYLATKPHKYVNMIFSGGLEFRDSYILTQRSLDRFCKDMGTASQKQTGSWDYTKFRTPGSTRSEEETKYFLMDTIALNEALRVFMNQHSVNVSNCELTNTGFVRKAGLQAKRNGDSFWNSKFREMRLDLTQYRILEEVYHGGYTHANRYHIGELANEITSYDFASSYPSIMCYEKFPMGKFMALDNCTIDDIFDLQDDYAFFGYLYMTGVECRRDCPMPPIAYHKLKRCSNDFLCDNGKLISASEIIVPFSDPDLEFIIDCYDFDKIDVVKCYYTKKDYLPDWFTRDFLMPLYENKCTLKGVDDVLYMLSKGMLNSLYGMCVQKIIRDEITEDFDTGEWTTVKTLKDDDKATEKLDRFYKNRNKYLPYQWGVWVTSYAQRNLFRLGACCKEWYYSDTDSVKGKDWDKDKLNAYNDAIRNKSLERNLGSVVHNGKTFILGVAEFDGKYDEFITLGSKRYCARENGELEITVAGVPKSGVNELHNDINNFRKGMVFRETGKTASTYIEKQGIHKLTINDETIEYGSAVRLDEVEYSLDQTFLFDKDTGFPLDIFYEGLLDG